MDGPTNNPDDIPKRGRPPKLTDEITLGICQMILDGSFRYAAGKRFGISASRFSKWMRSGRDFPDGIYGTFRQWVLEAEAEAERLHVRNILRAAVEDDWKASAWWLERKFPQRWGRYRGELFELKRRIGQLERELLAREDATGQSDGAG